MYLTSSWSVSQRRLNEIHEIYNALSKNKYACWTFIYDSVTLASAIYSLYLYIAKHCIILGDDKLTTNSFIWNIKIVRNFKQYKFNKIVEVLRWWCVIHTLLALKIIFFLTFEKKKKIGTNLLSLNTTRFTTYLLKVELK